MFWCGRTHQDIYREGYRGYFKYSETKEHARKLDWRRNRLYGIKNRQEQEDSPDVFIGMIQFFDFTVYILLDPGVSHILYVSMNFMLSLSNLVNYSVFPHLLISQF